MADFSGHKQAMRKADEAYRQSLLPLLLTPPLVTLDAYAPTVINPKEDKCRDLLNGSTAGTTTRFARCSLWRSWDQR